MSATYYHQVNSPLPAGVDYQVCIKIVIDGQTIVDDLGSSFIVPKSGKNDQNEWITVFANGTGSSAAERAHLGCVALVRSIAGRLDLDAETVTYGGTV